jgi:hypothetical protein
MRRDRSSYNTPNELDFVVKLVYATVVDHQPRLSQVIYLVSAHVICEM